MNNHDTLKQMRDIEQVRQAIITHGIDDVRRTFADVPDNFRPYYDNVLRQALGKVK